MLSPITSVANVRTRGALSSDEGSGAPSESQIAAAIDLAQARMIVLVTRATYGEVQGMDETALAIDANAAKHDAFDRAESYLAIAHLPMLLRQSQLAKSGFVVKDKVQDSETEYASDQMVTATATRWEKLALIALKDYLSAELALSAGNDNDQVTSLGVRSKDGKFFMMDT